MNLRFFGYILLTGAVTLAVFVLYRNSGTAEGSLIFSPVQLLNSTWLTYKSTYVDPTTYRTIDRTRGDVTTSEGQSYTMLRSVWVGDKQTFDGTWGWTQANMFHTQDHLFAWLWGKKTNGQMGVLIEQNGETSASDADTDIALSLIFAYARWQDPKYLAASRGIIQDIWNKEVIVVGTTPYMTADDIEKTTTNPFAAVNPSYLNPAAYKIFALIDWAHPWHSLADNSYVVLQQSTILSLDKNKSAHIPPDWIAVNKTTGKLEALQGSKTHTSNFGFDALRIPFRLALDWEWFKDPRKHHQLPYII